MSGPSAPASIRSPVSSSQGDGTGPSHTSSLVTLTTLFFAWGFLTCLNDVIIPHLKAVFSLSYFQAMLVQFCFFGAYGIMSVPAGGLVKRIGFKRGIVVGLLGAAAGCVAFFPAAALRSYGLFLTAFFVMATGIVVLQVSANPFVTILGPPRTASSRLTLTQAFNSLATTLAPRFGSAFILSTVALSATEIAALSPTAADAYRVAEAHSVQTPYLGLAVALAVLAVVVAISKLPTVDTSSSDEGTDARLADRGNAWRYPHLVLGAVGIFAYVGAEVTIGSFLVNYLKEPYMLALPESQGAGYLSYYWGGAMVGRFIGTFTLRWYRPSRVLLIHAIAAVGLVLLSVVTSGGPAAWFVIAVGLFNSIMFPAIFAMAVDGLGRHTEQGSGILCMAIVGGAIIPALQGVLADRLGLHISFVLPAVCYVYVAWYGLRGNAHLNVIGSPQSSTV